MNPQSKNSQSDLGTASQRPSAQNSSETRQVDATVVAVIPEFHQAKVRDGNGHLYAITPRTCGVDLLSLREGQVVRCTVTLKLPRVLSAEVIS